MQTMTSSLTRSFLARSLSACLTICAATLPALPAAADEDSYPRKPITLVVPFAAGGGTDTLGRLIGQKLQAALGQPVVVENHAGGNGIIATRLVLRQPADGYTLMLGSNSTHVVAPLAAKDPADAIRVVQSRFGILTVVANAPLVLAVRANAADRDLAGLLARAQGASVSFGTFGAGSSGHVMGEVLAQATKSQLLHVPYKGSAPALNDLLGGQIDSVLLTVAAVDAMIDGGKVLPLAVTGNTRVAALPKVPTFDELGVRDMGHAGWFAVFALTEVPAPVAATLSAALRRIVADAEVRTQLLAAGLDPVGSTPEQARTIWNQSVAVAAPVIKRAKIEF
jgi:tripartite-type tricarboxylate transporter receptor subunit TctC